MKKKKKRSRLSTTHQREQVPPSPFRPSFSPIQDRKKEFDREMRLALAAIVLRAT